MSESENQTLIQKQNRNFSFKNKDAELLDTVEESNNNFVIPAQTGSCYWAILKVGYENHDKPISLENYINQVAALLEERDIERWNKFKNKNKIKTFKNGEVIEKEANNWRKRIATNIQTMCRGKGNNPYGLRLTERGHSLSFEKSHFNGLGGYILRTK